MPVNKPRRLGSFAPLSSRFWTDDAIMCAGEKAEVLYARVLSFVSGELSDGFVSDAQLQRRIGHGMKDVMKRAQKLSETVTSDGDTLWVRDDDKGGYWVTAWLKWNRSLSEIQHLNDKDAARKGGGPRGPSGVRAQPDPDSERIPNGNESESDRNAAGFQPPHTETSTHTETRPDHTHSAPDGERDLFDEFWDAYPRKEGKAAARKAWPKACKVLDPDRLVKAADYWSELWKKAGVDKQFIPHPATWLNGQRWDDEPPAPRLRAVSGGHQAWTNPTDPDAYHGEL